MFSVKLNNQQHLKEQIKHSSYFVGLSRVFVCVHLRTFLVGRLWFIFPPLQTPSGGLQGAATSGAGRRSSSGADVDP